MAHMLIVRNADGDDAGEIAAYQTVVYREARNAPGGWSLTIDADNPAIDTLRTTGAGIAVYDDNHDVVFSGPVAPSKDAQVAADRHTTSTRDTVTFTGPDDLGCLWWRRAIPPVGQSHLTATGFFGQAAAQIVCTQLAEDAPTERRLPPWRTLGTDTGDTVTITGRYDPVGDILANNAGDTVMSARWRPSGAILFTVNETTTNTMPLSIGVGTVQSTQVIDGQAEASVVYALGQGELADRLVIETAATASPWSRIESVLDRRDLQTVAGLTNAANAAVKPGERTVLVPLVEDYGLTVGDSATVDLYGTEILLPVAETITTLTPSATTRVVTVGDPSRTQIDRVVAAARRTIVTQT